MGCCLLGMRVRGGAGRSRLWLLWLGFTGFFGLWCAGLGCRGRARVCARSGQHWGLVYLSWSVLGFGGFWFPASVMAYFMALHCRYFISSPCRGA